MLLLWTTNRKCHKTDWIVPFVMTLNDLEGHSPVARFSNGIRGKFVQYFARFQLTVSHLVTQQHLSFLKIIVSYMSKVADSDLPGLHLAPLLGCCSVLFFSRPRSEGWPHHGRTFSIYPCPLSFWLTLLLRVLSTSWCCPSRPSSPACTWHCSLHYLFLQATPVFPHGVTIIC